MRERWRLKQDRAGWWLVIRDSYGNVMGWDAKKERAIEIAREKARRLRIDMEIEDH